MEELNPRAREEGAAILFLHMLLPQERRAAQGDERSHDEEPKDVSREQFVRQTGVVEVGDISFEVSCHSLFLDLATYTDVVVVSRQMP